MLCVCAIVPFANDIFLSGMPQIQHDFNVANAGTMLSAYLLGLALSQLFYGPLFDYFGRKPMLFVGLLIFIVGTLVVIFAPTYDDILIGRFIQAIGSCSAAVASVAIVRDSFSQAEVTKYIAIVFGIIAVCPVISPVVGSYLQHLYGWQGSFAFLLGLGFFFVFVTLVLFKESMIEKNKHALKPSHMFGNYWMFLKCRPYLCYTLISCCSYATLFGYIAALPEFIITKLGFGVRAFGWLFLFNTVFVLIANFIAPVMSKRIGLPRVAMIGVSLLLLGTLVLLLIGYLVPLSLVSLLIPTMITFLGIGFIRPTAAAGAMHIFPSKVAGSASALFMFFCFIGGMITTGFTARLAATSLMDFAWLLFVLAFIAFAFGLGVQAARHQFS